MGTHVHLWQIHVNVWQNQYSIVKQNKVKIKIKKKNPFSKLGPVWWNLAEFLEEQCHVGVQHGPSCSQVGNSVAAVAKWAPGSGS